MNLDIVPDFKELARFSIETFHREVLDFPQDIIDKAIEYKALLFQQSYEAMLVERKR